MIGDKPLVKLGGDLIAITSDGYIPLLQFLGAGREQRQLAISDKIAPTVTEAVRLQGALEGWQAILFSEANWLLFNVPAGPGGFEQHVMNVQTGAWCKFSGMKAHCWETFKGNYTLERTMARSIKPTAEEQTMRLRLEGSSGAPTITSEAPTINNFDCCAVISSRHLQELRYQLAHLLISIEDCLASRQELRLRPGPPGTRLHGTLSSGRQA